MFPESPRDALTTSTSLDFGCQIPLCLGGNSPMPTQGSLSMSLHVPSVLAPGTATTCSHRQHHPMGQV